MWFDIEHARAELAWRPQFSNDEMFAESYDWYVASRGTATAWSTGSPTIAPPPPADRRQGSDPSTPELMRATRRRLGLRDGGARLRARPAVLARADAGGHQAVPLPRPRRLVSDSIWTFDSRQFAGWVPHQLIAAAWPSGPWYVVGRSACRTGWPGCGSARSCLAAGTGVAWAAQRLGFSAEAALAAGLLYQLSPYPRAVRVTDLLDAAALGSAGWIVGLTIGAATRTRWRDAASARS